tara:strand:- start:4066 stop:4446 length:381 start_codon:yes stop_codon:yes gene_type:complete
MATYAWTIDCLHTKNITKSGKTYTDVIIEVEATLTGTSETVGSISSDASFDLDMNIDNVDSSFTAYDSVTEDNVKTWIENRLGSTTLAEIKKGIEGDLEFKEKVNGGTKKGTTNSDGVFTASFPWS